MTILTHNSHDEQALRIRAERDGSICIVCGKHGLHADCAPLVVPS
jgi:hypothetical protein